MPPKRSSSRIQQPAQRRPRTERACNFCRILKTRCEPVEWGMIDRSCRRCVAQGLDCNLPRAARSQSPALGLGVQGPGPIRHSVALRSVGGTTEELTQSSEATVQYMLQQSELARAPIARWPPFMMRPEEQDSSTTFHPPLPPAHTLLQTPSLLSAAPGIEGYQQSYPNVAQGSNDPHFDYYPQDYYGQTTVCDTYVAGHATQSASDSGPNLGYGMEDAQPDGAGAFVNEQDASHSRSGEP